MGYPALVRKFVSKTFQKLAQSCHAGSDKKRLKFETFVFSSFSLERKKERKKERKRPKSPKKASLILIKRPEKV